MPAATSNVGTQPRSLRFFGVVPSVQGLNIYSECGDICKQSVIDLNGLSIATTDAGGSGAWGSQKLYTFPRGIISVEAVTGTLTISRKGTNIAAGAAVHLGLGSSLMSGAGDAFTTSFADMGSATITLSGGTATKTLPLPSLQSQWTVVDATGGDASNAEVDDVTSSFNQGVLNDNLASLAAAINAIESSTRVTTLAPIYDGTVTPATLNLNLSLVDGDSSGNDAMLLTGRLIVTWRNLGDGSTK